MNNYITLKRGHVCSTSLPEPFTIIDLDILEAEGFVTATLIYEFIELCRDINEAGLWDELPAEIGRVTKTLASVYLGGLARGASLSLRAQGTFAEVCNFRDGVEDYTDPSFNRVRSHFEQALSTAQITFDESR
jgi:hypothetical protein